MLIAVVLDSAAEEMEFAVVTRWYAQVGDQVAAGESLVEVEAEKASYDITAPVSGLLVEILAVTGDEVAVGATLGMIDES